jgi:predicted aspartyl protease
MLHKFRYQVFGLLIGSTAALSAQSLEISKTILPLTDIQIDDAASLLLKMDRTDRMIVGVSVNGSKPYPFVIDTGAERTVISHELGERLKLPSGPELTLATITGKFIAPSFQIDELKTDVTGMSGTTAPALARHDLGAFGLLGVDSLANHRVNIDFGQRKVELSAGRKRPSKNFDRDMIVVEARRRGGRLIISKAKLGNMPIDIVIDTGAQITMGNDALRAKLSRRDMLSGFVSVPVTSVTGVIVMTDFTQIRNIDIDGLSINNLPIAFFDNYAFKALHLDKKPALFLGMDAMRLFDRIGIDFAQQKVSFALPKGTRR